MAKLAKPLEHHVNSTCQTRRSDTWQRPEDAKGGIGGALGSLQLSHLAQARHDLPQEIHTCDSNVTFIWNILMNIVHVHALSCKNAYTFPTLQGPRPDPQHIQQLRSEQCNCAMHGLVCWREIRVALVTHLQTIIFWKSPNMI